MQGRPCRVGCVLSDAALLKNIERDAPDTIASARPDTHIKAARSLSAVQRIRPVRVAEVACHRRISELRFSRGVARLAGQPGDDRLFANDGHHVRTMEARAFGKVTAVRV